MPLHSILRLQLMRELDGFMREVDACPDDVVLWAVEPGVSNSVGTLALHVSGNLLDFVGRVLGGTSYVRNRDREFSYRGGTRAEVISELQAARAVVDHTLSKLDSTVLSADYPMPLAGQTVNTAVFLSHLGAHLAFHLGQAGYLRRIATGSNTSTGPLPLAALKA